MLLALVVVRLVCVCEFVHILAVCWQLNKPKMRCVSNTMNNRQLGRRPTRQGTNVPIEQPDYQPTTTARNRVEPLQNWIQYEFQVSLCKRMSGSGGEITFRAIWRWAAIDCIYGALPHCYFATTLHDTCHMPVAKLLLVATLPHVISNHWKFNKRANLFIFLFSTCMCIFYVCCISSIYRQFSCCFRIKESIIHLTVAWVSIYYYIDFSLNK